MEKRGLGFTSRFLVVGFIVVTFAGRAGAQVNWTPSNITTLAWYDAADSGTIAQSGGLVSQWNDKSGNGRHISQAVSGQQPSISGTTITFDGSDDILRNSSPFMYANGSIDIYIVASCATTLDKRIVAEANSTDVYPLYCAAQTRGVTDGSKMSAYIRRNSTTELFSGADLSATGAFNINTRKMYLWRDTGSQMSGRVDAGTAISANYNNARSTPLSLDGFGVGGIPPRPGSTTGSGFCNVKVNEIVITGNLSDPDRYKMEGYLAWKWGIESRLPDGHTYKPVTWNLNLTGPSSWNANASWTPNIAFPNAIDVIASVTNDITVNNAINLNQVITIGTLNIGDSSGNNYFSIAPNGGSLTFDVSSGSAAIKRTATGTGADAISANITLNDNLTVAVNSANGSLALSGNIGENGGARTLAKSGTGALTLSGANTYSGGTLISGGIVNAGNNNAFGSGAVTVNSTAVRVVISDGTTVTNSFVYAGGSGVGGRGAFENSGSGNATLSGGTITISSLTGSGGHFASATGGSLTISDPITSSVQVVSRIGTVIYGGGGSYASFAINQDTARLGASNGLATNATVDIGASGVAYLDLAGYNQSLVGITKNSGSATIGNSSTASDSTLTITGTTTYDGVIQDALGSGTKKVSLVVNSSGTVRLQGTDTYSGATTINAGRLALSGTGSINNSSGITLDGASAAFTTQSSTPVTPGITVASGGGTLGLSGTFAPSGANNITVNGALSLGYGGGADTLNITMGTGKLAFGPGSSLNFDVGSASDLVSFSSAGDWLSGSGNATLNLTLGTGFDYGTTYTVFRNVTTAGFTFANITGYDTSTYTASVSKVGNDYVLSFTLLPPAILLSGTHAVDENKAIGTLVGSFSMRNPAGSPPYTYSFVAGANDNSSFQLSGVNNSNLLTAAGFDFETKNSYTIDVRCTAATSETTDGTFVIAVNNVTETFGGVYALGEVTQNTTLAGTLQSLPGDNTSVIYTKEPGFDEAKFQITGDKLELINAGDATLGAEYYVKVRATGVPNTADTNTMLIKVKVVKGPTKGTTFTFQ